MAQTKVPGIYMIRNKLNGKVYIGQSNNIPQRFKQYRWAVNSNANYVETRRPIILAMKAEGLENFEFIIVQAGAYLKDAGTRANLERFYIRKYKSDNPEYGYNDSIGGELGLTGIRTQGIAERSKRAKNVFLYDTKTQNVQLYFSGAKGVGDDLGYGKDVMSHTVIRGSLLSDRYYVIPAKYEDRHALLEKLRKKKTENFDQSQKARSHSANAYYKYEEAVKYIDKVAEEFFGIH